MHHVEPDESEESGPINPEVDQSQKWKSLPTMVRNMVIKHKSVFRGELDSTGCTAAEPMTIKLKEGSKPVKRMPYSRNPTERSFIEREVRKLQALDIVEESRSPWGAGVVLVRDKMAKRTIA